MVSFPLIRIYSSVTYPDMLPPHKVRLNKKSTTLRLTMIFKQPLKSGCYCQAGVGEDSGFFRMTMHNKRWQSEVYPYKGL